MTPLSALFVPEALSSATVTVPLARLRTRSPVALAVTLLIVKPPTLEAKNARPLAELTFIPRTLLPLLNNKNPIRHAAFPLVSPEAQTYIATVTGARDTFDMIELVQFPWSPFCIVQRRVLEFAGVRFKTTNIPNGDRSLVWKLTKERYYGVPIIRDGRSVVFEVSEDSQVIAKYLDSKLKLGLFPPELEGVQSILWRCIENEIEGPCFRLTDIHWREMVPKSDQLRFVRHKERKFGRGCLDQWRAQEAELLRQLEHHLLPFEEMLMHKPFLLEDRPRFVDFDLYGMLGDFLYTGHYQLPAVHTAINQWHGRMRTIKNSK